MKGLYLELFLLCLADLVVLYGVGIAIIYALWYWRERKRPWRRS